MLFVGALQLPLEPGLALDGCCSLPHLKTRQHGAALSLQPLAISCPVPHHPAADVDVSYTVKPVWESYLAYLDLNQADGAWQSEDPSERRRAACRRPAGGAKAAASAGCGAVGQPRWRRQAPPWCTP